MTHRRIHVTRASSIAMLVALLAAAPLAAAPLAAQQPEPARRNAERAASAESPTHRLLYALENEWAQGVVKRDAAAVRRLVAPRWIYSDESGTMNREQGIAAFTGGTDTVTAAGNDDMHAIVYGSTAIVTGILWMRGRGSAGSFEHRYRYTDTWMKLGGRWQCIASQDYLLPAVAR
jgi:ketosteroid isomerase-like protein